MQQKQLGLISTGIRIIVLHIPHTHMKTLMKRINSVVSVLSVTASKRADLKVALMTTISLSVHIFQFVPC